MEEKKMYSAPMVKTSSRTWIIIITLLGTFLVIATVVVLGLAICLGLERASNQGRASAVSMEDTSGVCLTEECVELSNQISQSLDMSVDPCEDFYLFSCKGFKDEAIIPFGHGSTSSLSQIQSINMDRIRVLMESSNSRNLKSFYKAQVFYHSCLDIETIDQRSLQDLHELLVYLGGWPLVGIDLNISWSINEERGYLTEKLLGSTAFFSLEVFPNARNTKQNIFYISQSGLTFPGVNFTDPDNRGFFVSVMVEVFQAINLSISTSTYQQAAEEIVDFEIKMAQIIDLNYDRMLHQQLASIITYVGIMEIFPQFNWTKNLDYYGRLGSFSITSSDFIGLLAPTTFLRGLDNLIQVTESRILQNYAKWHLIYNLLQDLSKPFRDIYYKLQDTRISGIPPRYRHCISEVESKFKFAIARGFTEEFVNPRIMGNISVIVKEVKNSMRLRIKGRDWLDPVTKKRALKKLKLMKSFLGYPVEVKDDDFLELFYNDFDVSPTNGHFINKLNAQRACSEFALSYIGEVNSRNSWDLRESAPTTVNAVHFILLNQIYIFEGILDTPVFEHYWPNYFKYATIGSIIGHEITHGFDNTGRHFDEAGKLNNWWSEHSQNEYNKRADCFVDQYSNYTVKAGPVDGRLTLGENIADNGGIVTSYMNANVSFDHMNEIMTLLIFRAYKNVVEKSGPEKKLPGLPYSPEQLFFIGAAQEWCLLTTLKRQSLLLNEDVHSPGSVRPIKMMSNSREFAKAFSCPTGSRMNPKKKCELW